MEKIRVYELAKDLNTTSKRLMEKLAEVNVVVKNHMSFLEDHELDALYKHIGVIKHDDGSKPQERKPEVKKPDTEERKAPAAQPQAAAHPAQKHDGHKDAKKDVKSAPRIIRTTEVVINTQKDQRDNNQFQKSDAPRGDVRSPQRHDNNQKRDMVRVADANSGLLGGFVRDNRRDLFRDSKNFIKNDVRKEAPKETPVEQAAKEAVKPQAAVPPKEPAKEIVKEPVRVDVIQDKSQEIKQEMKQDVKPHIQEKAEKVPQEKAEPAKAVSEETIKAAAPAEQKAEVSKPAAEKKAEDRNEEQQSAKASDESKAAAGYSDRPQSDRPQADRPYGDRPQGDRSYGDRPQGDRPQGDRPYGNRQYGDRPQGDRPQGDRPYGNRPQGDRPYGNRPQGDRPQGDRPYGNRPYGDRPQGDRPQGDRPYGNRPYGDRPQGDRPQGDRPYGNRPYGDRPQGDRPYGNRPQGDRPYGNRPQGDRPQGDRPYGNRPQGDRPYGNRPYGDRPKSVEIPKAELSEAQKEELNSQKSEIRREFVAKDIDKDAKREQKREAPKAVPANKSNRKFKPQTVVLSEKKGVHEVLSEDFILNEFYDDSDRKTKKNAKPRKDARGQEKYIPPKAVLTSITIPETVTVKDLAEALKKTSTDVIKKLMVYGIMATLNQEIDFETATVVAEEFGVKTEKQVVVNEEDILFDDNEEEDEGKLVSRPPVVVVMGHVDHGKTSLLDAIKSTNVTESEAGGITQHIGAYMVKINGRNITFLDTPGHEAFTAMRARGAQVTDIAILVVAADDGVMPQTVEAINHAKAANVSIIVAINKIDKPGANPERVKQELTEHGLVAEEWGGDVICVPVSAKKRENIDQLLEMVLLTADMLELKANPDKQAKGTVIEAKLDTNRGPLATVLVQRGTLNLGDSIVTGTTVGRIRAMTDDKGNSVKSAGPSMPVELLGMPEVPEAGELFYAITDEKVARHLAEKRKMKLREQSLKSSARVSLDDLFTQIKEGKVKDLNIIVKADVQGSVEAVKQSLEKLSSDEVRVKVIHDGVGAITESDVTLAQVSNAIIIGFNVRPAANVADIAQNAGVDLRMYSIIYNAIEDVQAAMKGMLEPTFKEVILGHTEIRQIFKVSGVGTIGGAYVTDGKITRNADVRLIRDGIVVHTGKLASLKRFKDDAKDVAAGFECGISIERYNDIKEGDVIEAFAMEEVAR